MLWGFDEFLDTDCLAMEALRCDCDGVERQREGCCECVRERERGREGGREGGGGGGEERES